MTTVDKGKPTQWWSSIEVESAFVQYFFPFVCVLASGQTLENFEDLVVVCLTCRVSWACFLIFHTFNFSLVHTSDANASGHKQNLRVNRGKTTAYASTRQKNFRFLLCLPLLASICACVNFVCWCLCLRWPLGMFSLSCLLFRSCACFARVNQAFLHKIFRNKTMCCYRKL